MPSPFTLIMIAGEQLIDGFGQLSWLVIIGTV